MTTETKAVKFSKSTALEALRAAKEAKAEAKSGPCGGCGRAYVVLSGGKESRPVVNAVAAACKDLGLMFLRKAYGVSGPAIYIGYDNARGDVLARSEAFAATLNAKGIACYADAVGD